MRAFFLEAGQFTAACIVALIRVASRNAFAEARNQFLEVALFLGVAL